MTHDEAYELALARIGPYLRLAGRAERAGGATALREGIRYLDVALRLAPQNWAGWWLRGKAQQALGNHEDAYGSFHRARSINRTHIDVARELVAECLETARAAQAVEIAEELATAAPGNAGLLANLALAYLVAGRLDDASHAVELAQQLDAADR